MPAVNPDLVERRQLYIFLFTLVFLGDIGAIIVKRQPADFLPYVVVAVLVGLGLALLITTPRSLRSVEHIICFGLLGLNVVALYVDLFVVHNHFGDVMLWVLVCYLYAFFILRPRTGLLVCGLLFAVKLGLTLYHTYTAGEFWGTFLTFYTSQIVGITLIFIVMGTNERHRREVERLAHTDSLVGKPNRRHLYALLKDEMAAAARTSHSLSLVIFDVDHFKNVNDTYGHPVGDRVLSEIAQRVAAQVRGSDWFGRWGGEEFLLILPGTGLAQARRLSDRLRQSLEEHEFPGAGRVTASFGGAECQPEDTPETLIKRADDALYRAKDLGRNQVVMLEAPPGTGLTAS